MYGSLGKSVVEDYPAGYPRFSALIATHDSFYICRRFSNLRARLLLLKQDKLASLERHLQRLHQDETNVLRLGSSRRDDNVERQDVLRQIDAALEDYGKRASICNGRSLLICRTDAFIERNHRTFAYETASAKLVSSLLNWVDGNGCIARAETAYLDSDELISIASIDDTVMVWLETWVEKVLIHLQKYCGKKVGEQNKLECAL